MNILLGSNNKHKAEEIKQILEKILPGKFQVKRLSEVLESEYDVVEDGTTLEQNAYKKALEYNQLSGFPCFADDTGLEIDFLDGKPGVYSARFAGEHGNDSENRKKVRELLINCPEDSRTARFRTVICFNDGEQTEYFEGICNGRIILEERGSNGFGYDSIFIPDGYDSTFAELPSETKNSISHRAKATESFINYLKNY